MASLTDLLESARGVVMAAVPDEVRRWSAARTPFRIVDVREAEEREGGTIEGALCIPRGTLELEAARQLPDPSVRIVTYCAAGTRALLAAKTLKDLGYADVRALNVGFAAWRAAGHPVTAPKPQEVADVARPTLSATSLRARYARHLDLPEVGEAGQERLRASRVLLVGAGGLGSPVALYLAAAGVGTLTLCDHDVVDVSNLQRQVLHSTSRVGLSKVESARRAIEDLNPDVTVVCHEERVTAENTARLFAGQEVVVDGSDDFATRYVVNDACVRLGIPLVHGSVFRFDGQATTIRAPGPCYRCLYPEPPPDGFAPSCRETGVLGVVPGLIGLVQATEVLKLLLGIGDPLVGRLFVYDAKSARVREIAFARAVGCKACG